MFQKTRRGSSRTLMTVALAAALPALTLPEPAAACSQSGDQMIGTVCVVAFNFCPRGYLRAEGQLVSINDHTPLFALIGTTYGGNGQTNFGLPDLRGRFPIGVNTGGTPLRHIPLGYASGAEDRVITTIQMPTHNHAATGAMQVSPNNAGHAVATADDYLGAATVPPLGNQNANLYTGTGGTMVTLADDTVSVTVGTAGASQPFPTYDPSLGMTYCIAAEGAFPARD